jgi:hypothetical protein
MVVSVVPNAERVEESVDVRHWQLARFQR